MAGEGSEAYPAYLRVFFFLPCQELHRIALAVVQSGVRRPRISHCWLSCKLLSSHNLSAAATEQNALRATRRLIARIKCEACGGVQQATAWHVLNANDAQILDEDTEAQQERDLGLFRRWHRRRGTDAEAALGALKRRTGAQARELAEDHERDRKAPSGTPEQQELDSR